MKAAFADDDAQAKGTPRCTFCGRCPHHAEVLIVSSDGVHAICDGCVACVDMIRKRRERAAPLNGTPTTTKPPLTPALRSSPLRSGENADDPATSAEVMKAKFANDDDLDISRMDAPQAKGSRRVMSALSYVHDGRERVGHIIARGRLGFEGFDREERSLGLFKTAPEAANAIAGAAASERGDDF